MISIREKTRIARRDLINGIKNPDIWLNLSFFQFKNKFRRTTLGPFWITLMLLIWILALTYVNQYLFNAPIIDTVPHIIVGMVFWTFLMMTLNEGCMSLIEASGYLKNLNVSPMTYILQSFMQSLLTLSFNSILLIPAVIMNSYSSGISLNIFYFFRGLILLIVNSLWIQIFLSISCLRFRDIPKIINSFTQIIFFITPVFWIPSKIKGVLFIDKNPFFHLLEVVRAPLLNINIHPESTNILIVMACFGYPLTILMYLKYYKKLRKWI